MTSRFQVFFESLVRTGSLHNIPELADFLYIALIAIQLLVYRKFDSKDWSNAIRFVASVRQELVIPVKNAIFVYHFKNLKSGVFSHLLEIFRIALLQYDFYITIADLADLLFTAFISFQLFFYTRFDTKIRLGYDRLLKRA